MDQYQEGQTATGPNGAKLVFQGGSWQPMSAPAAPAPPAFIPGPAKTVDPIDAARLSLSQSGDQRDQQRLGLAQEDQVRERNRDVRDMSKTGFDQASKLRSDYYTLPSVKNYTQALPVYAAGLQSKPDAAGDLNLIYAYAKVMDPNSVVREGEQASVAGGDTYINQKTAELKKQLGNGGTFQPEYRRRLREEMENRMGQLNQAFIADRVQLKGVADRAGINPLDVVGEHPGTRFQDLTRKVLGREPMDLDYNGMPVKQPAGRRPSDPGTFTFNDQIPEGPRQGARLTDAQNTDFAEFLKTKPDAKAIQQRWALYGIGSIEDADAQKAAEGAAKGLPFAGINYKNIDEAVQKDAKALVKQTGDEGIPGLVNQGLLAGNADELSGVATAATRAAMGDFDVSENYQVGRDAERMRLDQARKRLGTAGTLAELGGGLLWGGAGGGRVLANPSLLGRVGAAAIVGAPVGALAGFGYGEGAEGSLAGAGIGAVAGGALSAALPVAGQVVGNRVGGLSRLLGRDPTIPRRMISQAMEADGNSPRAVAALIEDARGRGSPLAIGDTGDNVRGLLSSVGRQPGRSRTIIREGVVNRQLEQGDRISEAATRDLGPSVNIRSTGDELIEQARATASPLYDRAYAAPGASSVQLDDLMTRPSMRSALGRARNLAAEEGRDPTTLGFDLDQEGNTILTRVPSFQTLDYMKRGMDDVIETYRDSTTGRLNLDTAGRAANNTLRQFITRIDNVNPAYAGARATYSGPARMKDALESGFGALSKSSDDVSAQIASLNGPAERDMYANGVRKAINDLIENRTDGGDKVQALLGTPKKRRVLAQVFGGRQNFERFVQTLEDERLINQTYQAVAGNSATAGRMADDALTGDTGLAESAVGAALRGSKDGIVPAIVNGLQSLRQVGQFGVGEAGQVTRQRIASHLLDTDPAQLRELLMATQRLRASERLGNRNAGRRIGRQSIQVGELTGRVLTRDERPRP